MYGTQAVGTPGVAGTRFENDVNMYGTQAAEGAIKEADGLRMM